MKKNLNLKPGKTFSNKGNVSGFLIKEDSMSAQGPTQHSSSSNIPSASNDVEKDIEGTLSDSISATQKDIEKTKLKGSELDKVLSVTKDIRKRNYIGDQKKELVNDLKNKNTLLQNQQAGLKKEKEQKNTTSSPVATVKTSELLNMSEMKMLRKKINETIHNAIQAPAQKKVFKQNPEAEFQQEPVKQSFKVVFDKSTGKPWEVLFTERGFLVGGTTRLSFENVEMAIHKNYNIVLDGGQGLILDQVKLNKILKYKNKQA